MFKGISNKFFGGQQVERDEPFSDIWYSAQEELNFRSTIMKSHLAIYGLEGRSQDYIDLMLKGEKTVDAKVYWKRIPPWQSISIGDMIYLKQSGGPIRGRVEVSDVNYFEVGDPQQLLILLSQIRDEIGIRSDDSFDRTFRKWSEGRYATVFWMVNPESCDPFQFHKRDRRVWVPDFEPPQDLLDSFNNA